MEWTHRFSELEHLPSARRKQMLIEVLSSDEIRNLTARFSRWFVPGTLLPPLLIAIAFALLGLTTVSQIAIASILSCVAVSLSCSLLARLEYRAEARTIRKLLKSNDQSGPAPAAR